MSSPSYTNGPGGHALAFHKSAPSNANRPGVIFLGGFKSDMTGTKATFLEEWAAKANRPFVRFDYSGHGASEGKFTDGAIGDWAADAIHILDTVTEGPQILVGSSMGGWVALLAAVARRERVAGLVGIAAAPDFTEDLMWAGFSPEIRETLTRDGIYRQPSEYDDGPYEITMKLIEDGRKNLLLRDPIQLTCPVRLIQGMQDPDVPWQTALRVVEQIESQDARVTLIKEGDHRLSTDADLALLAATLDEVCGLAED